MLMHEVLADAASQFGDNIAFDAPDGMFTFTEFYDRVNKLAGALQTLGLKKGDRLSILAPNCANYIAFHYATSTMGVLLHVLNTRHVVSEMAFMLNNAETSALILHEDFADKLDELKAVCPSIRFVIGIGNVPGADHSADELVEANHPLAPVTDIDIDHPILLIYTSGTTGRPKGALQTHEGSVMVDRLTADAFLATEQDVFLAFMPFFHQAGLLRARAVLSRGGTIVIPPKMTAGETARYIAETRVSIAMLPPPYDTTLLEVADQDNASFSSFRLLLGGGGIGSAHAARIRAFCEKVDCRYMGVYGQTEVTGTAVAIFDEDYFKRPLSCGRPFPGIDLQVWDEAGVPLNVDEVGEIMIRSRTCIPGYWRNETSSRELYTGEWLHTGDLGKLDGEGFLYFVDRKKELIKTGAENVYPREVENVLRQHPDIEDMVVLGLPDPDGWGEMVVVVVVLKEKRENMMIEDVRSFCRGKLAGYKIPKKMRVMDAIPRSFSGKPEKLKLKALFVDPVKEAV